MAKGSASVPASAEAAGAEPVKKGRGKLLLLLLPLLLLAAGGGGYVAVTQYPKLAAAAAVLNEADAAEAPEEAPEPEEYGEFLEIQGLIVNPAGTSGKRYLMVNVGLESDKGKVLEEIEQKEIVVRDRILRLLSHRTVPELADIAQRDTIKNDLRASINEVLEKGRVTRLYFTQYVLQ